MWKVVDHPDAEAEFQQLDARDAAQVTNVITKLKVSGPRLPFPHSSNVAGAHKLRELRPGRGRSVIRPLYRQIGSVFVIGAYGPEAQYDKKGFKKACRSAEERLAELEEE